MDKNSSPVGCTELVNFGAKQLKAPLILKQMTPEEIYESIRKEPHKKLNAVNLIKTYANIVSKEIARDSFSCAFGRNDGDWHEQFEDFWSEYNIE